MSRPWIVAMAVGLLLVSGCDSTPVAADPPGPVTELQISFGPNLNGVSLVTLRADGTVLGAPARIEDDYFQADEDGWVKTVLMSAPGMSLPELTDYELRVMPTDTTLIAFTRSGPFGGTLSRKRSGATSITFALVEKTAGRVLLGPFLVPVIVER